MRLLPRPQPSMGRLSRQSYCSASSARVAANDGVAFSSATAAAGEIAGKRTTGWWCFLTDQASRRSLRSVRRDYVNAMAVDVEDDEPDDDGDEEENENENEG